MGTNERTSAGSTMDWDWVVRYFMAGQKLRKSAAEEKVPKFTLMNALFIIFQTWKPLTVTLWIHLSFRQIRMLDSLFATGL